MSDTKENTAAGWASQDAGAPGWNAKAAEQLSEYEQASRERVAGIKADRAEREAKAEHVTIIEERDVTDPKAHTQATGGRVADPEQARDAAASELRGSEEQAQASEIAADVVIQGMSEETQAAVIGEAGMEEVAVIEAGGKTWEEQAGELRAAELEGDQMDLQAATIAQQVESLNPAEQAALAQIMGAIDNQQQEHGHDLER